MNTASNQQDPEQGSEEIDLKEKLKELMGRLPYDERKLVKESKWQDTDKDWDEGFLEFIEKDVEKRGKSGIDVFKDFVKHLRRDYENMSSSEDPQDKKLAKTRYELVQKILGIYTSEQEPEEKKKKKANEKAESIYGMDNIKFTIAHIRKQILGLLGLNDPWWTKEHEQKRQARFGVPPQKQALENTKSTETPKEAPLTESTPAKPAAGDDTEFEAWKAQKAVNDNGTTSSHTAEPEAPAEEKKAA